MKGRACGSQTHGKMHEGLIVVRHRDHLRIARTQIRATAQHFSAELIRTDFR